MTPYVIGIGNAVMDVISPTTDERLESFGIEKGIMQLIERERSEYLMAAQADERGSGRDQARLVPGGSVANTLSGIGSLGLKTAFIGKVAEDMLGRAYADQTRAAGTDFVNAPFKGGDLPTSRSIIFVTPDGERSMNTYLGISAEFGPEDVSEDVFDGAGWLFLEGYLFDKPKGKDAFLKAADACRNAGGRSGISLSDPFCVDRHRGDFRKLIEGPTDYAIGNIHEWRSLYETEDLDAALAQAAEVCSTVVCTRSGDPAILIQHGERVEVPVNRVTPVDATGAGDQFAAGMIYGLATGKPLDVCGRMACLAAAEVISHVGPRPEADMADIFRSEGLI